MALSSDSKEHSQVKHSIVRIKVDIYMNELASCPQLVLSGYDITCRFIKDFPPPHQAIGESLGIWEYGYLLIY